MTDTPDRSDPEPESGPERDDAATPPSGTPTTHDPQASGPGPSGGQPSTPAYPAYPPAPAGSPGYPPPGYPPPPGYGAYPGPGGPPGYGGPPAYDAQQGYGRAPGYLPPGHATPPGGIVPLAPLGAGQILRGAVGYIRTNPVSTLVATGLIALVSGLVQGMAQVLPALTLGGGSPRDLGAQAGAAGVSLLGSLVSAVVSVLASALVTGVLMVVLRRALLGRRTSFGEAWRGATKRVWGLAGANILVSLMIGGIAVAGLLVALLIGFLGRRSTGVIIVAVIVALAVLAVVVYLSVLMSMTSAAYMMEDIGPATAMGRSRALVRGNWWRIFGVQLLAGLAVSVIALAVFLGLGALFGLGFRSFVQGGTGLSLATALSVAAVLVIFVVVVTTFFTPFVTGVTGLLYADQRIRRERFDLELAARAQGQVGPGTAW